ncbi:MAG: glycosyltransferase family 4 protein [Candidatus Aminicenantes bacterium]|nr:glycosyltransferase family 4 protein [Candidatus Aminicenantes bacterium]
MKPAAIVFVSHTADRDGAPIELLRFLGWLKTRTPLRILILLQQGGELESDFRKAGSVRVWKRPLKKTNRLGRRLRESLRWEGIGNHLRLARIRCWLFRFRVVLVYANTAFCGESLTILKNINCPRICRLHEMAFALKNYCYPLGFCSFEQTLKYCESFVVVSEAVGDNLVKNHKVAPEQVRKIYGSVEPVYRKDYFDRDQREELKAKLGIPRDVPVIGGAGRIYWGKGTDLFVQLAAIIHKRHDFRNVHFLWVGGDLQHERFQRVEFDMNRARLNNVVHFTGHQADPYPYYSCMDMLAMISREDSFPLVNPEVGLLGIPMVCFQNSGGSEEWASGGCGRVVPYLDLEAFARELMEILADPAARAKMGAVCRRQAENLLVERNAPRLYRILQRLMNGEY